MPATSFIDLNTIHNPATSTAPPATWGDQARDDLQYLYYGRLYVCTSATRPSGPTKGDTIYETDTGKVLVYYGATTGWQYTWAEPWGIMGYVEGTTTQSTISSITDLTGMSITFTAVANRRYMITGGIRANKATNVGAVTLTLRTSAPTVLQESTVGLDVTNISIASLHVHKVWSPSAGSQTVKLSLTSTSASVGTTCDSTRPLTLCVQDIGPNGTVPSA